jgi:hypothetical protein
VGLVGQWVHKGTGSAQAQACGKLVYGGVWGLVWQVWGAVCAVPRGKACVSYDVCLGGGAGVLVCQPQPLHARCVIHKWFLWW